MTNLSLSDMEHSGVCDVDESTAQLRFWRPIAPLRPFVDHFAVLTESLGSHQSYQPLAARNDCFLEFHFADRFRVVDVASGEIGQSPRVVLVGPHARRQEDIIRTGTVKVFHIGFTPVGFYSLFQIPGRSIANVAESADVVVGSSIHELEERLALSPIEHWRFMAEQFLLQKLLASRTAAAGHLTARVAHSLLSHRGALPVAALAHRHGRSVRHIERTFEEHVGLSPKLFSRIKRLQEALRMAQRESTLEWSAVAQAAGYFDQSHMGRDFRSLTGETPAGFMRLQRGSVLSSVEGGMSHLSYS